MADDGRAQDADAQWAEEDAAVRRLIRLALFGTAAGALAGTAAVIAAMVGVVRLQASAPPAESTAVLLIAGGTIGGLVVGAIVAWWLLAPLGNWFRRGMLATVSAFATVLLMLLSFPVRGLLGVPGLLGFVVLCLAAALFLGHRARVLSA
jgi:hypothetical protein